MLTPVPMLCRHNICFQATPQGSRLYLCEVSGLITMTTSYPFQFRMFVAEALQFSFNN